MAGSPSLWRLVALALAQLLAPGCSAGYVHPAPRTCTPIGALASGGQPSSVHSLCRPADGSCTTSDGERLCSLDLVIRGTSNGANGIPTCACAFVQNCNRRVPWLLEPGGGAPPTTMQVGICDNSAPVMAAMVMVPLLVVVALMIMCAPVDSVVKARLRQYDRYARTWLTQKGLLTGKAAYVPPRYEKWRVRRHSPTSIVLRGIHHTLGGELGRDEGAPDGRAGAPNVDGRLDRNHIYPLDGENIGGQWSWPRKRLPNDPSAWLNTERPLRRGGEGRSTTDLTTASSRSRSFRPRNVESDRALVMMHHDSVSIVNERRKPRRRRGEEEPPTSSDDDEYGYSGYGYGYGYGYGGYGGYSSSDGEGSDGADGDDGSGGEGLASEGRDNKRRVRAEGGDTGAAAVMEQGGGSSATDTVAAEEGGTASDGTPAADEQEDAQPVEAEQSPAGQGGKRTRRRGSRSGYSRSGYSGYSGSRGYGYSRTGYSYSGYSSDEYSSDDEVDVHAVRVVLTLTAFPRKVFSTEYHHALRVGVAKAVSALANNLDEEIVSCHADATAVAQVSSAAAAVLAKLKEHAPIRPPELSTPRAVPEAPGAANDAESSDLEAKSPDPATTAGWGCPRLLADAETGDGGGPGEAWASMLDGVHIVRVRSVGGAEALKRARHSRKKVALTAAGLALIAAKRSGRGWRRIAAKRAAEAAAVPVVPTMHTSPVSSAVGVASNAIVAFGAGGKIESGSGKAVTPAAPAPAPGKGLAQTIGNVLSRSLARTPAQAKKSAKVAPEARVVPDSQEDNGGDGDGSEGSGYGSAYSGSGYGGSGSGYGYNSSDSDYDYDYDYGYAPSVSSEDEDHVEEDDNEPRNWPGSAGMYDMPDAIAGQEQRTKKKKKQLRLADRVPGLGTQVEIEIETAVGPVLSSTDDEWEEGDHLAARHAMRKRYHQRAVARTHGLARALGLEEGGDGQLLADQGTAPLVVVKPVKRQPFHDEGYHERHVAYENRKAAKATADASAATLRETFQHALGTSLMGAGMPLRHPRRFAKSAFVRDTTQFAFKYDLSKVEDWVDPEEEEGEYSDEEGKGEVAEITYNETELDFRSSQQPMPRGFYLAEKGKWRLPGQEWDLRPLQDPHERIRRGKPNTVALDSLHAAGDKAHRSKMTVNAELAAVGHLRHGVAHSKRQHTLAAALHADRATAVAAADGAAATATADAAAAKAAAPDPAADATLEDVDGGTDDEVEGEPTDTQTAAVGGNADADGDAGRSDEDPVDVADDEALAATALKAKGGAWFAPNLQRWMLPAEGLEPAALRPDAEYNSAVRVERRQQRRADAAKKRDLTTVGAKALAGLRAGTDVRLTFVGRGVPPEYTQELLEAEVASVVAPARRKKWLGGGAQDPAGTPRPYDFFFMPTDPDPHTRRPKGHGAGSNGLGYFIVNFISGEAMARFFDAMNGRRWELGVLGTKVMEAKAAAKAGAGKKGKAAAVSTKLGDGGPEGAHSHCLLLFAPVQGRKAQQAEVARWQKHAGGAWKSAQKRQQKALAGQQGRRPSFFGGIVGSAGAGNNTPDRRRSWVNDWGAPMLYDPTGRRQGQ